MKTLLLLVSISTLACAQGNIRSNIFTVTPTPTLSSVGEMRLQELSNSASAHYVGFKPASSIAANVIWQLPAVDGTSGQVLSTNGSKVLSWASPGLAPPVVLTLNSSSTTLTVTNTGSGDALILNGSGTQTLQINGNTGFSGLFSGSANSASPIITGQNVGNGAGVFGQNFASGPGVSGSSSSSYGIYGTGTVGVYGISSSDTGVQGVSTSGKGGIFSSNSDNGLESSTNSGATAGRFTHSGSGHGIDASSSSGYGAVFTSSSGTGLFVSGSTLAVEFGTGTVQVDNALTVGSTSTLTGAVTAIAGITFGSSSNSYLRTFSGVPSCASVTNGWFGFDTSTGILYICNGGVATVH